MFLLCTLFMSKRQSKSYVNSMHNYCTRTCWVCISGVAKASTVTEMKERSEPSVAVVYESVDEGKFQHGEVLTESPLYQLHGTVETNVS